MNDVYFWDPRGLAEDLRAGRISERQRMWYLLMHTVLMSSSIPLNLDREWSFRLDQSLQWWSAAAISAVGVRLCYDADHQGDDREFLSRFICLSWPITVRLGTLVLLPFLALQFAMERWASSRGLDTRLPSGLFALGFGVGLPTLYYWWLRKHIRWVAAVPIR